MFLRERQDRIVELIRTEGRVTVLDLASRFGVTEDCIRKDLKQLDVQGALKRVYGGAISVASMPERNVSKRVGSFVFEKRIIAKKVYEQIDAGETLFFDVSTTALAIAEPLAHGNKHVTVVSNMMGILRILSANPVLTVLGLVVASTSSSTGLWAPWRLSTLAPIRFDKAFLGGLSVDLETGEVMTYIWGDGLIKQLVIKNPARSFLVVDTHKFDASGTYAYAKVSDFDAPITNQPTPRLRAQVKSLGSVLM